MISNLDKNLDEDNDKDYDEEIDYIIQLYDTLIGQKTNITNLDYENKLDIYCTYLDIIKQELFSERYNIEVNDIKTYIGDLSLLTDNINNILNEKENILSIENILTRLERIFNKDIKLTTTNTLVDIILKIPN